MNELYFIGMDIVEETNYIANITDSVITSGMNEDEIKAYRLGISNMLSALKTVLRNDDDNAYVLHIQGLDNLTEFTLDEIETYLNN